MNVKIWYMMTMMMMIIIMGLEQREITENDKNLGQTTYGILKVLLLRFLMETSGTNDNFFFKISNRSHRLFIMIHLYIK